MKIKWVRSLDSKILISLGTLLVQLTFFAADVSAQISPQGISLEGNILTSAGLPEESASVNFTIQIKSPGLEGCILYQESQTLNMSNSGGMFALTIGSGVRPGSGFEATSSLKTTFNNAQGLMTGLTCASGTTYTPVVGDRRDVILTFNDGTGGAQTITQALAVQSVPFALYADTLQGKLPGDFVAINATTAALTQANLELIFNSGANVTKLQDLIAGTSAEYAKTTTTGGASLPVYAGAPTAPAQGAIWYDSTAGRLTFYDGTSAQPLGTSGGSVTSVIAGTGLSGGTITTTGTISMPNVGTAGTYFKVTTDAQGRVSAGSALAAGDIPNLDAAKITTGTFSSSLIPSGTDATKLPLAGGTMSGAIAMGGQNITGTGYITMSGGKYLGLGSYDDTAEGTLVTGTLTLGAAAYKGVTWFNTTSNAIKYWDGTAAIAVATGGSAISNLNGLTTASQSFAIGTSGTAPAFSSLVSTHTLNIPMASTASVTAGLMSNTEYTGLIKKDGSVPYTADQSMGSHKLTSVTDPSSAQDAATKNYADTKIAAKAVATSVAAAVTGSAGNGFVLTWDQTGNQWTAVAPASSGTVTSVGLTLPSIFTVTGSPVTSTGTLTGSLANQTANTIFAGPSSGGAAAPTFRAMASTDLPTIPVAKGGTGSTSLTPNGLLMADGTGSSVSAGVCGANQTYVSNGTSYSCQTVGTGTTGFLNGGNSFAAAAVIGTNDSNTLSLETNNVTRMTLDTSGNVGIGTAAPTTALQVGAATTSYIRVDPTASKAFAAGYNSADRAVISTNVQTDFGVSFASSNSIPGIKLGNGGTFNYIVGDVTGLLLNPTGGNVGVGTTSPSSLLSVGSTSQFQVDSSGNLTTSGSGVVKNGFQADIYDNSAYTSASSSLGRPTGQSAVFDNNAPLNGAFGGVTLTARNTATTWQSAYLGSISNSAGTTPSIVIGQQTGVTAYTERMRIDASGNVGIGTTSPNSPLHVYGAGSGVVGRIQAGAGNAVLSLKDNTEDYQLYSNGGNFGIWDATLTANRFVITNSGNVGIGGSITASNLSGASVAVVSGNVGIGTTTPNRLLEVAGPIRMTASALPSSPAVGDIAIDSGDSNKLKWYDGAWKTVGTSTASGTVTSVVAGTGLSGGTITTTGTIALAAIANNTMLANTSGSSAVPVATSLSTILDSLSSTQGAVLYRGSSGWAALAPGSNGQVLQSQGASANPQWAPAGAGTVTSVALALPSIFSVTGSPITSSGTLTGALATQTANTIFAGPSSGGAVAPTFRALASADLPTVPVAKGGTGSTSLTPNGLLMADGTGSSVAAGVCGVNQTYVSNGTAYSCQTIGTGTTGFLNGGNSFAAAATLGTNDANTLGFKTNGSTQMTIDTSGNVGIGTTTPGHRLDVSGQAFVSGEVIAGWGSPSVPSFFAGNGGMFAPNSGNDLAFSTSSTEKMRITSSGNVGIGTTSPGSPLDVAGNIHASGDVSSTSTSIAQAGATVYPALTITGVTNGGQDQLAFLRARGTSTPSAVSDGDDIGAIISRVHNGTQYEDAASFQTNVDGTNVTGSGNHPGVKYTFYTRKTTDTGQYGVSNPSLTIRNNGNVGLGTTSPVSKLHVNYAPTASANYGLVSLGSGAFDGSTTGFFTGNSNGTVQAINAASGYTGDLINYQVGGVSKFKVDASGNITGTVANSAVNWASPSAIGSSTPSTGAFTSLNSTGYSQTSGSFAMSGSGVKTQIYSGTTGTADTVTADSLTSGSIMSLTSASTAAATGNTGLNIAISGANATSGITRTGVSSSVTATGSTSTNVGGYFSASGATNNYGLIVANGNVGIGTTTPSSILNVVASNPNVLVNGTTGSSLSLQVSSNTSTAQPNINLVKGALTGLPTGADNLGLIGFTSQDSSYSYHQVAQIYSQLEATPSNSSMPAYLAFATSPSGSAAASERMRITSSGNVGIGTTTPAYPLQVTGVAFAGNGATNSVERVAMGGAGVTSGLNYANSFLGFNAIRSAAGNWAMESNTSKNGGATAFSNVDGNFYLAAIPSSGTPTVSQTLTDAQVFSAVKMTVLSSGYVGIGTTSPGVNLAVVGSSASSVNVGPSTASSANANLYLIGKNSGTSYTGAIVGNNTGQMSFQSGSALTTADFSFVNSSGTTNMLITPTGSVGIGTISPNAALDVGTGFVEWGGQSRVTATLSRSNSTTLTAIPGLSANLAAGKTYYFDITLYTTSGTSGGIKVDLNGGTATATSIIGDSTFTQTTTIGQVRYSALNSTMCSVTSVSSATCHITGTITVNAGGTFIPEFAQNASNATASTVAIGSVMIVNQIN